MIRPERAKPEWRDWLAVVIVILIAIATIEYFVSSPGSAATSAAAIGGIGLVLAYFIPTAVAHSRKKKNAGAITALNFFLGWTLIGWVVALVWAMTMDG